MKIRSLSLVALATLSAFSTAEVIFSDNFESGTFGQWVRVGTTTVLPAVISTAQANSPTRSAFFPTATTGNVQTDRYVTTLSRPENVGSENLRFTFWQYDASATGGGRMYIELRSYDSNQYGQGTLEQIYAAGKNNSVTAPGQVYNGNRYQGRGAFGSFPTTTGWFNIDTGDPRTIGWHRIEIIVCPTIVQFFVDGKLGMEAPRGNAGSIDSIVMGSLLGSDNHDTYWDDVKLQAHPFEFFPMRMNLVDGTPFGGTIDDLQASDDNKVFVLSDESTPNTTIEFDNYVCSANPTSFQLAVELSATRNDLSQFIEIFNLTNSNFETVNFDLSSLTDVTKVITPSGGHTRFIDPNKKVVVRTRFIPSADLEAADGWSESFDLVRITATP